MANPTLSVSERHEGITQYLTELAHLVHAHAPQATVEVLSRPYEDEDAHFLVWLPTGVSARVQETLRKALTARSTAIFLDTGLLILAGVYATSQRPTRGAPA